MIKRLKLYIPLLIFVFLVALFVWGLHHDPRKLPSSLINKPLPEFKASSLINPNVTISNEILKGHYTLLNVFASWCVECHAEHPVLIDIAASRRVSVIGLSYKDQPAKVVAWLNDYGNPYQAIINDSSGDIAINFGVYGTPETFLIDSHGRVVYKKVGPISAEDWRGRILPIMLHARERA